LLQRWPGTPAKAPRRWTPSCRCGSKTGNASSQTRPRDVRPFPRRYTGCGWDVVAAWACVGAPRAGTRGGAAGSWCHHTLGHHMAPSRHPGGTLGTIAAPSRHHHGTVVAPWPPDTPRGNEGIARNRTPTGRPTRLHQVRESVLGVPPLLGAGPARRTSPKRRMPPLTPRAGRCGRGRAPTSCHAGGATAHHITGRDMMTSCRCACRAVTCAAGTSSYHRNRHPPSAVQMQRPAREEIPAGPPSGAPQGGPDWPAEPTRSGAPTRRNDACANVLDSGGGSAFP
jgi:hypothetical protein